jgi:hypothetical protein
MADGLGTKQTHATLTMSTSASESSGRRDAIEADIAACCRKGFRVWEKNKIQQRTHPICYMYEVGCHRPLHHRSKACRGAVWCVTMASGPSFGPRNLGLHAARASYSKGRG